jgi:hypothetical protein
MSRHGKMVSISGDNGFAFTKFTSDIIQYERRITADGIMDEGIERDHTSGGGGPSYAARSQPQYNSAFATRVLQNTCV